MGIPAVKAAGGITRVALGNWLAALQPFASYADHDGFVPDDYTITQGSRLARRQLTMGDCRRAAEAHKHVATAFFAEGGLLAAALEGRKSVVDQIRDFAESNCILIPRSKAAEIPVLWADRTGDFVPDLATLDPDFKPEFDELTARLTTIDAAIAAVEGQS